MFVRIFLCLIVPLLAITFPQILEAREIPGQKQPEFTKAVQIWLSGGDLEALELLSNLAKDGNTAAQILLANIASRSHMHEHVTSDLPRRERISLLRIPEGLSGKSWLTKAQIHEPLAAAMLQSSKIGEKAPAIAALIEYGEPTAALLAAQSMLFQGEATELLEVIDGLEGKLPEEASVLIVRALDQSENAGNTRYSGSARTARLDVGEEALLKFELAWTAPSPLALIEDINLRERVVSLSHDVRSWTPIKNFCEANCSQSRNSCIAVGASTLNAAGPFPMRSPAESLISNDVYWSSGRADADLARLIRDVGDWRNSDDFVQLNSCFFENMQTMQAKHGHAKIR